MSFTEDYAERVYAGVLGKIIGVYLGRPFEGWSYEAITEKLGEINYYVNDKLNAPLIVTDDDISGTFTFLRALPDYGNRSDLTAEQIGQTWLNYLIENRTVLWWGGLGNSTEHTAYLRMKRGILAPRSGSIALNGKVVAEQIGSQIFIDGWAMVSPGDPEQAAALAAKASCVSHDGEAIYGAQVLAAMEAQAFVERDIQKVFDVGTSFIPRDSLIYRLIQDIRAWHEHEPDWRKTRVRIVKQYGYDKFGGNCHIVPNHALIVLALLYGNDNFQKSLMIANTAGWDTDCNSGNVGCLLGIKNGLEAINKQVDWRGPVADRLYLPTADGGRAVSDAVIESYHIINTARALVGESPQEPKQGARFHFGFPGAVQGFQAEKGEGDRLSLENVAGHSQLGVRSLACRYVIAPGQQVRAGSATFITPEHMSRQGYRLITSPTLYSGQTVRAALSADEQNTTSLRVSLYVQHYGVDDEVLTIESPSAVVLPGKEQVFEWRIPDTHGLPIALIGIVLKAEQQTEGSVYLDYLTWSGTPWLELKRSRGKGQMWKRAWVDGVDHFDDWMEDYRLIQDSGRGLIIQGTREWTDYRVSTTLYPHMVQAIGLAARVQGMQRYYALLLREDNRAQLVKLLDGEHILAEEVVGWELNRPYELSLQVEGTRIRGWIDGKLIADVQDVQRPLQGGAVALICEEGRVAADPVIVQPIAAP